MIIDLTYPNILGLFSEHLDPKRSESASFLIWYLENYYRLDRQEAVDAVCDQSNDKGVDGIYVNDSDQTINVFQSKISQKVKSSIGDSSLREFLGTLQQFSSKETVENLMRTAGQAQVVSLIKRCDLLNKLSTHEIRGEFLVNLELDANGAGFLNGHREISFVGKKELVSSFISSERNFIPRLPVQFDVQGIHVAQHVVDADRRAVIAPVRAKELVVLEGISDQSLFAYNVRGPLGKTKVNRDMVKSISQFDKHKIFPLFHNGITIIAKKVDLTEEKLIVEDYHVVNGCQSITSLYNKKAWLTDDLKVLTKFIQLDPASAEAQMITEYSNNQNGVRPRDFKSNHQIQIRLQTEFSNHYTTKYIYEIKRGEAKGTGDLISNEEAGLYLMAFDLREPWATHRKYEIFEDKHSALFGRPEVTADRIVLCRVIMEEIERKLPKLENQLVAKHVMTKYMILYVIRNYFDDDSKFNDILRNTSTYMRNVTSREKFRNCIGTFVDDIIVDFNMESKEFDEDFDYRDKLRDQEWAKALSKNLVKDYLKQKARNKAKTFQQAWDEL